jgi:hypothetical protein
MQKNSTSLHNKSPEKLGMEGMCLTLVKVVYNKPIANIILSGEKLKAFSLKSEMRQGYPLSLARAKGKRKK